MSSKKIDYLTIDPEIPDQKWVCLSFLTPELVKNCDVRSVKVRGCYSSEDQAKERCEQLQKIDGLHNVYVAPVGKWLPWCDDPEKATDFEYAETELNKLMKAYQKNQENAKLMHEQRKTTMVNKNIEEMEKRKEENLEENLNVEENTVNSDTEVNSAASELEQAELLYKQLLEKQNNI